jgi:UDP-galactopyranose mutase
MDVLIIGAGVTGLSSGYHLKKDYMILEALPKTGGLAGSYFMNGFTFDHGGVHVLRTTDNLLHGRDKAYFNKLQKKLLGDNISEKKKMAFIYLKGNYHVRPFQHNLYGAKPEIIKECIEGLKNLDLDTEAAGNMNEAKKKFPSFKDELINIFGAGMCKHFMFPYNEKAWCHDLSTIRSRIWVTKRFGTIFDMNHFKEGVEIPNDSDSTIIKYPKKGGFGSTGDALYERIKENVEVNSKVTRVDINNKIIEVNNTRKIPYNHLVSTIPIPELIQAIGDDAPQEVKDAAVNFKYTSMLSVNVAVDRDNVSNMQYIYYPDREISFTRVSFPLNQSKYTAPSGKTGICVEVPYSLEIPIEKDEIIVPKVMRDLIKVGILKEDDTILFKDIRHVKHSYVVQHLNIDEDLKIIRNFLKKHKIHSIGRYGEWKHSGTEHAIDDGRKIAAKLRFNC